MLQVFNMRIILACIYYSNYILIKHTVTYAIVYVNENHGSYEYILESMICLFYLYKYMNSFCSIIFQQQGILIVTSNKPLKVTSLRFFWFLLSAVGNINVIHGNILVLFQFQTRKGKLHYSTVFTQQCGMQNVLTFYLNVEQILTHWYEELIMYTLLFYLVGYRIVLASQYFVRLPRKAFKEQRKESQTEEQTLMLKRRYDCVVSSNIKVIKKQCLMYLNLTLLKS